MATRSVRGRTTEADGMDDGKADKKDRGEIIGWNANHGSNEGGGGRGEAKRTHCRNKAQTPEFSAAGFYSVWNREFAAMFGFCLYFILRLGHAEGHVLWRRPTGSIGWDHWPSQGPFGYPITGRCRPAGYCPIIYAHISMRVGEALSAWQTSESRTLSLQRVQLPVASTGSSERHSTLSVFRIWNFSAGVPLTLPTDTKAAVHLTVGWPGSNTQKTALLKCANFPLELFHHRSELCPCPCLL